MEDEGRHTDCGKHRPHVRFGYERHRECEGSWACRQAFIPCPRCPDLLVPRHVRIHQMLHLPRAPHGDMAAFSRSRVRVFSHRIREASSTTSAVVRDGCVAANSAAVANAP